MKNVIIFLILMLAAGMLGCGRQPEPRHIIILPDVSGSIDRQALQQAFKAIDELMRQLHRGDRIAIIPILGDAQAEASGRIIRFEVPEERRAYDVDLRDFQRKLGVALTEMQANAVAHPGSKTDILGSVELAEQEFQLVTGQPRRLLIILSDFIQEDQQVDFRKDRRLATVDKAHEFAKQLMAENAHNFRGIDVYLGLLQSSEYAAMALNRRSSIQEFWVNYFNSRGAQTKFFVDGIGLIERAEASPL